MFGLNGLAQEREERRSLVNMVMDLHKGSFSCFLLLSAEKFTHYLSASQEELYLLADLNS